MEDTAGGEQPVQEPTTAERIAATTGPALVAFGASWCMPWRLLQSALDDIEASGEKVIRVDTDREPRLADRWAVVSLPTFVVVNDGEEVRRWLGAVTPSALTAGLVMKKAGAGSGRGGMRRRR
jgi:thioredoxin-like negative regulator of GroEL